MIHGIESIYAGLEKKRTLLLSALDYKPEKFAVAEYVRIDTRSISPYHNSFEYLADDLKNISVRGIKYSGVQFENACGENCAGSGGSGADGVFQ